MRLIINASNLSRGGGVQVGLSFLNELKDFKENEYHVFLSSAVRGQLEIRDFPPNFTFYHFEKSPGRCVRTRWKLNRLEKEIQPDCVFTVFGPAHWIPKSHHVCGFALVWLINPDSEIWNKLSLKEKVKRIIYNRIKKRAIKKENAVYIVESHATEKRMARYLKIPLSRIHVVNNTFNHFFSDNHKAHFDLPEREKDEFRLITLSANYIHKNISIIKKVIPLLLESDIKFRFYLTFPEDDFRMIFSGYEEFVKNLGPVEAKYCPSIYSQCDAMFLPTLLESFSASYPEAMKMKLPVLTSDLDFATSICNNAALYFNPYDPENISEKIITIATDKKLRKRLIEEGTKQVAKFPGAKERARMYLDICKNILAKCDK